MNLAKTALETSYLSVSNVALTAPDAATVKREGSDDEASNGSVSELMSELASDSNGTSTSVQPRFIISLQYLSESTDFGPFRSLSSLQGPTARVS